MQISLLRRVAKILRARRAFVPLILILVASSAAFTLTFSVLFSAQNVGSSVLGESSGVVIVSSATSRTPITSAIPIALMSKLGTVSGINTISPEVLAPSTVILSSNNENNSAVIMVRGVDTETFDQIDNPKLLAGSGIQPNDTTAVMVGDVLANQLKIGVGSSLVLTGAVYPSSVVVQVKGIFHTSDMATSSSSSSSSTINDEIVAPLWVGQWLRGFDYNTVSLFRIKVDQGQSISLVRGELLSSIHSPSTSSSGSGSGSSPSSNNNNGGASSTNVSPIVSYLPYSTLASGDLSNLNLNVSPRTSSEFLSRALGLSQESVLLLSALVFVSMSVAIVFACQEMVFSSKEELETLRTLGMSSGELRVHLILIGLVFAIAAGVAGWIAGIVLLGVIPGLSPFVIAFYSISPMSYAGLALIATVIIAGVEAIFSAIYSATRFESIFSQEAAGDYAPDAEAEAVGVVAAGE